MVRVLFNRSKEQLMKIFNTTRRKVAVGAVGVIAALGIGGTAFAATSSSPSTTPSASTTAASSTSLTAKTAKTGTHRALLARADHATIQLKVKGAWVTYTMDIGKVTEVSPTSITLSRPDGQSVTESISLTTKFAGVSSESAVKVGKAARVLSKNGVALRITQRVAGSGTTSSAAAAA
jgi:hypothetical protein